MVSLNTGEWMLWPHYFVLDTEYVTLYINVTYHMRTENIANRHQRYQFTSSAIDATEKIATAFFHLSISTLYMIKLKMFRVKQNSENSSLHFPQSNNQCSSSAINQIMFIICKHTRKADKYTFKIHKS